MTTIPAESLTDLYLKDETAWLEAMAELIRLGQIDSLDFSNLREYLSDMAQSERREVANRLAVLCAHILKWRYQPKKRSRSWKATIETQRQELVQLLESRVLRNHAEVILGKTHSRAVKIAATETGLSPDRFPATCPFTIDDLVGDAPLIDE